MRLIYALVVAAAAIFACCEGANEAKTLDHERSGTVGRSARSLRTYEGHDEKNTEDGDSNDEERAGVKLDRTVSEKFSKVAAKLTRSKSLSALDTVDVKLADKEIKALLKGKLDPKLKAALTGEHDGLMMTIDEMGYNPVLLYEKLNLGKPRITEKQEMDYHFYLEFKDYWARRYRSFIKMTLP